MRLGLASQAWAFAVENGFEDGQLGYESQYVVGDSVNHSSTSNHRKLQVSLLARFIPLPTRSNKQT